MRLDIRLSVRCLNSRFQDWRFWQGQGRFLARCNHVELAWKEHCEPTWMVNAPGYTCSGPSVGGTGTISCGRDTAITAGTSDPIQIVVNVDANVAAGTIIQNVATVSGTATDADPTNNTAQASVTVTTSADLQLAKVDSPDPVNAGSNITYIVTVLNNGPSDAQNVAVSDTVPDRKSVV